MFLKRASLALPWIDVLLVSQIERLKSEDQTLDKHLSVVRLECATVQCSDSEYDCLTTTTAFLCRNFVSTFHLKAQKRPAWPLWTSRAIP